MKWSQHSSAKSFLLPTLACFGSNVCPILCSLLSLVCPFLFISFNLFTSIQTKLTNWVTTLSTCLIHWLKLSLLKEEVTPSLLPTVDADWSSQEASSVDIVVWFLNWAFAREIDSLGDNLACWMPIRKDQVSIRISISSDRDVQNLGPTWPL